MQINTLLDKKKNVKSFEKGSSFWLVDRYYLQLPAVCRTLVYYKYFPTTKYFFFVREFTYYCEYNRKTAFRPILLNDTITNSTHVRHLIKCLVQCYNSIELKTLPFRLRINYATIGACYLKPNKFFNTAIFTYLLDFNIHCSVFG